MRFLKLFFFPILFGLFLVKLAGIFPMVDFLKRKKVKRELLTVFCQ